MQSSEKDFQNLKAKKFLVWLSIVASAALFSILGAFAFTLNVNIKLPQSFLYSTFIILLSSFTMHKAVKLERKLDFKAQKQWLWVTLGLGTAFFLVQLYSWQWVFQQYASRSNLKFYIVILTSAHLLHVLVGMVMILTAIVKNKHQIKDVQHVLRLEMSALFWHFVDILWVLLYVLMLLAI